MLDWLFASALVAASYSYVVYPAILFIATRRRPDPAPPAGDPLPTVTVVLAALNEAAVIEARIANLQALEYPADRIDVLMGSDGSTDDTVALARAAARNGAVRVEVVTFERRRGKAAVIHDLVSRARGEIIVLTDANTEFAPDAVSRLVRWFGDGRVGAVGGQLDLVARHVGGKPERRYWQFETLLKRWENRVGAVLGANGGIYAIRRSAYVPIAADVITDDFVIPLLIRLRGHRLVFDPAARAVEDTASHVHHEFRRRVRIGTGNMQALGLTRGLLHPRAGWTAFAYWSHKVLRWVAPWFAALAAACALAQLDRPFYVAVTVGLLGLLAVSAVGWLLERVGRPVRGVWAAAYALVAINLALTAGTVRFFAGLAAGDARWERTPR